MNVELKNILEQADILEVCLQEIRPLGVEALQKIKAAFEMEYTYESNKIEGNTLTLQETALVVNEGVTISGKSIREHLEAINHAQAIEFIKEIASNDIDITERTIKEIHALVLHGINREQAGRYRNVPAVKRLCDNFPKSGQRNETTYYTALEESHVANNHELFYLFVANAVNDSLKKYSGIVEG